MKVSDIEDLESFAKKHLVKIVVLSSVTILCLLYQIGFAFALFINEKFREAVFYIFTRTNPRDELEEKAVNDAIKRSFFLNASLLVLLTIFTDVVIKQPVVIETDNKQVNASLKIEQTLNKLEPHKDEPIYLIPRSLLSSNGLLLLFLFQLLSFRTFLYLNHRRYA